MQGLDKAELAGIALVQHADLGHATRRAVIAARLVVGHGQLRGARAHARVGVLGQECRHQAVVVACGDRADRIGQVRLDDTRVMPGQTGMFMKDCCEREIIAWRAWAERGGLANRYVTCWWKRWKPDLGRPALDRRSWNF